MHRRRSGKSGAIIAVLVGLLALAVLSACATPTPQIVEKVVQETVVVEKVVRETAVVEKEVPVVVTATPAPALEVEHTKLGGTLTIATGGVVQLNPLLVQDDPSYWVLSQIFNSLVRTGRDGRPIPDLALFWENPDDTTWIFHLRQGVMWHDDNPVFPKGQSREVVADDVKWTLEKMLDPETKAPLAGNLANISEIEVVDNYTVKITTSGPDPFLLGVISLAGVAIVPHEAYEQLGDEGVAQHPVGSGPFKFVEYLPDDHVTLVRNEAYWKRPYLDQVIFRIVPDPAGQLIALEAGEVDVQISVPLADLDRISQDDRFVVYRDPAGGYKGLALNGARELLSDLRARQAIAMAMDVDNMIFSVWGNSAERAYGQRSPGREGYDPTLARLWKYDPEQAKALLAEAGWEPGADGVLAKEGERFAVSLKTPNVPEFVQLSTAIAAELEQVGIKVEVQPLEIGTWIQDMRAGNVDMVLISGFGAPNGLFLLFHSQGMGAGATGFADPEVDALLEQAMGTIDDAARQGLWREAQARIYAQVPHIPLAFTYGAGATLTRVHDYVPPEFNLNLVSTESNVWVEKN